MDFFYTCTYVQHIAVRTRTYVTAAAVCDSSLVVSRTKYRLSVGTITCRVQNRARITFAYNRM